MKKAYISPAADIVRIEKILLQSASSPNVTLNKDGSVAADRVEGRRGYYDPELDEELEEEEEF